MDAKKIYWVVLKIQKTVSYIHPLTGEDVTVELGGCAGYIPVFLTEEEARDNSCNGKFDIAPITA